MTDRCPKVAKIPWSDKDITGMLKIINENKERPVGSLLRDKGHVEFSLSQLIKLARVAMNGGEFQAGKYYLNLGRVQEILGGFGGHRCWAGQHSPYVEQRDYVALECLARHVIDVLGIEQPTEEYVTRKTEIF